MKRGVWKGGKTAKKVFIIIYISIGPLNKIRKFYDGIQQISGKETYKYITVRTFQELTIPHFDGVVAKQLFNNFDYKKRGKLHILRFICAMVWTSYASKHQKIHCKYRILILIQIIVVFNLFDFDLNGTLTIEEMILIFLNTTKALSILTGTESSLPLKGKLQQAA